MNDWTSQKARASADGGTNTSGYVQAQQAANPTTTTTSTATQSGTGGAGGDTVGAVNETGMASTGGNETVVYGGDIVAMNTGAASANGGAAAGGTVNANGGAATGGPSAVNNTSTVTQGSAQGMTLSSNWQKWSYDNDTYTDSFNRKKIVRGCCW